MSKKNQKQHGIISPSSRVHVSTFPLMLAKHFSPKKKEANSGSTFSQVLRQGVKK